MHVHVNSNFFQFLHEFLKFFYQIIEIPSKNFQSFKNSLLSFLEISL